VELVENFRHLSKPNRTFLKRASKCKCKIVPKICFWTLF